MKNNKALSKYKVSSIASSYCSSLHLRIITHALTQRRCFSSLFNLMMTSGSNMVPYFYLFFFRAKNVGCEVRRCVRQLNFFFFLKQCSSSCLVCCISKWRCMCSQMCLPVFFFIYVNTYTWWLQQKLASSRTRKNTSIFILLLLLTLHFETSENWKGKQSCLNKKQKWKQNQTNQHTHTLPQTHTARPLPKKGRQKKSKFFPCDSSLKI